MDGTSAVGRISSRNFFSETKFHPGVDSARSNALSSSASAGCTNTAASLSERGEVEQIATGDAALTVCRSTSAVGTVSRAAEGSSQNCAGSDFSGDQALATALL